ncbi:MAG: DUF4982 domain-containing protein, partial [Defluviitaleaceae bacterium]|nr:DUF4982 domain-containing protein [Defluviitaleaceae bacterium]
MDYLGEAGIGRVWYEGERNEMYPWHQAWCGDIDVCGFKRPQSFYRDFVWGRGTAPYIGVFDPAKYGVKITNEGYNWTWPEVTENWTWGGFEGKPVKINVYSGGDEVELALNGASLGRKPAGKAVKYLTEFETEYAPGELTAITYENGAETCRTTLKTAGKPVSVRLTPDRARLERFDDLAFVTVELFDAEGNHCRSAGNELYFSVSGAGILQAVGTDNPKTEEMYVGGVRKAHGGRAMAVVRAKETGEIVLNVAGEGLKAAEVKIVAEW